MIVYHGSYLPVEHPDLLHSRTAVDFGRGFYTTPIPAQAESWARRFMRRHQAAFISQYVLDETIFSDERCLRFDSYSETWLDFILACRTEKDDSDYAVVMGGIANDRVFDTVELFLQGLIQKGEAIRRLRFEQPNVQIALRTQEVIAKYLHFQGSKSL